MSIAGLDCIQSDDVLLVDLMTRGFPGGTVVKNPPANARDTRGVGLISGSGRSPGGGHRNSLQYSCLEKLHGVAGRATVHEVAKS